MFRPNEFPPYISLLLNEMYVMTMEMIIKKKRGLLDVELFAKYCRHRLHHQPILIVVKCFLRMSFNLSQGAENKFISQWGTNQKRVDFKICLKQNSLCKMNRKLQ